MEPDCISEEYSLTWKGHIQHVRDSFSKLLQSNDFCDVILYTDGHKIGAHKVFLTACSGYFQELFRVLNDDRPIIVLKGIQFEILQYILRFIYNGQVNIEREKLNDFLETANFLKISGLLNDKIVRRKADSLVFERDHCINTDEDERENLESHHGAICSTNQHVQSDPHIFDQIPRSYRTQYKTISLNSENERRNKDVYPNHKSPTNSKYSLDSPVRIGEWSSDYENKLQRSPDNELSSNSQSISDSINNSDNILSTSKRRKIISERRGSSLEDIKELDIISDHDFAKSLEVEIEISSEDDEDDTALEKEMLKTSLASKTESGFRCNICSKTYVKKDSLKKHFTVHTKNTTCMICGLILSRRTALQRHLGTHGIKGQ